jgi:hypothetical protein
MKVVPKTITAITLFTLLLSLSAPFSQAASADFLSPQLKAAIAVDADSFINSATDYNKNWEKIPGRIQELKAKANPTPAEITTTRNDLVNLKRLLNTMKTSLTSLINKLKAANKYVEQDNFVATALRGRNAAAASKLQAEGGAHTILDTVVNISDQLNRIDQILADPILSPRRVGLRSEPASFAEFKPVRVAFSPAEPAAPVFALGFTCRVLAARLIIKTVRGTETQQDVDQFVNTCSGQ